MEITCDRESNPNNSNHFKLYTWSEKIKETNKKIYIKKTYNVRELLNTRN